MAANPAGDGARPARLAALAVVLLALLPSAGTLGAPWIAEDSVLLAAARADGPWVDWSRSQGGLLLPPRFWRPLVSTSWALQEAATGTEPSPLRLFNLALHALVAWLVFVAARRLGTGTGGAFLAGAWIALFPEQGGTSTWIAGRTDLLCAVFLMASVVTAFGRAPSASAPAAFLACAAKEFGFLAPLWIALLAAARGEERPRALRRAGPALLAVSAAFAWRRLALGEFGGGYASEPLSGAGLAGALAGTLRSAWPSLAVLSALLAAGAVARSLDRRVSAAALLAAALAVVPLYPLLADGWLEPENRRLFYVAECACALAAGLCWSRRTVRGPTSVALAAVIALGLTSRAFLAWSDTHDWARSARMGEQDIARARAALAGATPGSGPVLFVDFPVSRDEAYCLGFGLAARFLPPFPATPRPVWPWRLAFVPEEARERPPLVAPRADGSIWPLDDAPGLPALTVRTPEGTAAERVELDTRVFFAAEDLSPRLALAGPAGARVEGVLFTELGYEPVPLGALGPDGTATFSLMQILTATNGAASAAELLQHAADLRARRAFLELRALASSGEPSAASRWIEIAWPPELLALSLGK